MCLYTQNIKPLVSKKDMVVIKKLKVRKDGILVTPYQHCITNYGKTIKALHNIPNLFPDYSDNGVSEGVIHSYICKPPKYFFGNGMVYVRSTVKAGTPFFVSLDVEEIASRELEIGERPLTDSDNIEEELAETKETIYGLLRNDRVNIGMNGERVGDVLLSDMTYRTPDEITDDMDVIGIAGFIRPDGKAQVISLQEMRRVNWKMAYLRDSVNVMSDYQDTFSNFNGIEETRKLHDKYGSCIENFPALKYCIEYKTDGTKEGDWFFPSIGEAVQIARNSWLINHTVGKLNGRAEKIDEIGFWTSTKLDKNLGWACRPRLALPECVSFRDFSLNVRPSIIIK